MLILILPLLLLTILGGIAYCGWLIFRRDPEVESARHAQARTARTTVRKRPSSRPSHSRGPDRPL